MAIPKHIAISLDDISDWSSKNNTHIDNGCEIFFRHLNKLLEIQAGLGIPIITFYLLPENADKSVSYIAFSDCIADFFNNLSKNSLIHGQKIKISVFGKWYNLPGNTVEALKKVIDNTKEHDVFFTNFCINYDAQEEITDACRIIALQVKQGKIDPEMITKNTIKENIYSSYFVAPDIVVIIGDKNKIDNIMLWDSMNAKVYFVDKRIEELRVEDVKYPNS